MRHAETSQTSLKDRLIRRIRRGGPLTFAAFMEAALYDPDEGFYSRPPGDGHFVTSPHLSPAFGDLLARQVAEVWDLLGKPRPLTVVELGAGDGRLASHILTGTGAVPELEASVRYAAVERTRGALEALRSRGLEVVPTLRAAGPITGCVLANELLDNLPFHRLRGRRGGTVEVLVDAEGDRLVETEGEPTAEALAALAQPPPPGEERPVCLQALALVRDIAESLERGYAFLFDYGFVRGEAPGPVHAYRHHEVLADVLDEPGSRDVTAAVDLSALAAEAERAGLAVWGPVSQRAALLGLGFRRWTQGLRLAQGQAETRGDWREANRLFAERSKASILIDEGKLGGLRLLILGTKGLPAPAAALGDRERGC